MGMSVTRLGVGFSSLDQPQTPHILQRWHPRRLRGGSRQRVVPPTCSPCLSRARFRSTRRLSQSLTRTGMASSARTTSGTCWPPQGQLNVKNEELEAMVKEAPGPINFTVFLTMFGEKLKGADPEDVIVSAFKVLDPEATGAIKKEFIEELLTTQCDRFTPEEMTNLWAAFPPDVAGNVDYKNICYVITHGEEKEEE